ncbi:hypothetical protein GCM10010106_23900 [Thermopolyspora flexuosa]|uniref:hypothetical protein n=1 Tax=Thermopolyspora flexuosa TaxID=103836 RepID=UPI00114DE380|nr:hypothetical protein [Thermopolyspora flexuosa]GGM76691.1 hypothetical protein GCM10010106_23900 [Thermopolyspora flexuosa]
MTVQPAKEGDLRAVDRPGPAGGPQVARRPPCRTDGTAKRGGHAGEVTAEGVPATVMAWSSATP